jgi:tRNA A-37 threonylcarbamoyl transferase component Bud32
MFVVVTCYHHPNLVGGCIEEVEGCCRSIEIRENNQFAVTMHLLHGTKLSDFNFSTFNFMNKFWIWIQILDAVSFIDYFGLHHWDLHDGNIIIVENQPIIIDFGAATTSKPNTEIFDDNIAIIKLLLNIFENEDEICHETVKNWYNLAVNDFVGDMPKKLNEICRSLSPYSIAEFGTVLDRDQITYSRVV